MSLTRQRGRTKRYGLARTRDQERAAILEECARVYLLRRELHTEIEQQVAAERARCLAIARLYPDNLMAREIARRIEA